MIDRRKWILQKCKVGEKILDVGCTDGWIFKDTPFAPGFVTSIDIDKYDFPGFIQMDAHRLHFLDKSFDIVILGEILEHVDDPIQVLKEANRVGKRILITVPDEKNWDEKYFPYETLEQGMKRRNLTLEEIIKVSNPNTKEFYTNDNYKHLFHNRHYTESTLKQDLKEAGIKDNDYKLERLQYDGWSFFTIDINASIPTSLQIPLSIPKGPIITFGYKEKLRVALISTPFFGVPPQKYGGLEQIVWDLAEALDELGHEVTIFAPEGSQKTRNGFLVETGKPIGTVNVDWYKEEERAYNIYKPYILDKDNKDRSNIKYDVIHDHTWFGFPYMLKIENPNLRIIKTHHGGFNWETAPLLKPNLVAISKFMQNYTRQYFQQRGFNIDCQYVYNGINLDKYPYQSTKTEHLLFVGRLSTFKQPHIAMEIARKTGHKLDIIGGTFVDNDQYIIQLDKMVENDQNINIYKDTTHEFKIRKMQDAKALLFPSNSGEPFGLVALESMSCGTPVIALNDGAISEVVIHNKTGFICNNIQEMVDAVNKIHLIKAEDCRARAEQLSRKVMAENYINLYQKIIRGEDW